MFIGRVLKIKVGILENIIRIVGMPLDLLNFISQIRIDNLLPTRRILLQHILQYIPYLPIDQPRHLILLLLRELYQRHIGIVHIQCVKQFEGFVHDAPAEADFHVLVVEDALGVVEVELVGHAVDLAADGLFGEAGDLLWVGLLDYSALEEVLLVGLLVVRRVLFGFGV